MGMHKKEAEKQSPWETATTSCAYKVPSLCLVIQSEVKGFKVFPEALSQDFLLFLADLTLPPVRLVRNIKNGFTGHYLSTEKSQRSQNGDYSPQRHPPSGALQAELPTSPSKNADFSDFAHTVLLP
jgi:hypothetical protein